MTNSWAWALCDGHWRFYLDLAACKTDEITPGMPARMTFEYAVIGGRVVFGPRLRDADGRHYILARLIDAHVAPAGLSIPDDLGRA